MAHSIYYEYDYSLYFLITIFFLILDSEEETGPRLKPVFVRKKDRVTVIEKEKEKEKQKLVEAEAKKMAEDRRRYTLKVTGKHTLHCITSIHSLL